jgi:hypothetical protein
LIAVYNEENTSSKAVAPVYDQLAGQLSRANRITFAKVSVVAQATIAQSYSVTKYGPQSALEVQT